MFGTHSGTHKVEGRGVVIRNKTGKSKSTVGKRYIEDMIFGEP
jgi:hypothetical protein